MIRLLRAVRPRRAGGADGRCEREQGALERGGDPAGALRDRLERSGQPLLGSGQALLGRREPLLGRG